MCMFTIDQPIQRLCRKIDAHKGCFQNWRYYAGKDLLHEACICIFGSQMIFEVSEMADQRLRERGFLRSPVILVEMENYKKNYEEIETEFQKIAPKFGYPIGCVDLAMWGTVRVAKREEIWCD